MVNDSTPKQLYINKKAMERLKRLDIRRGGAQRRKWARAGGDGNCDRRYDNSGRPSFQITNFSDDSNVLYHNDGDSNFTDVTYLAGLRRSYASFSWLGHQLPGL